MKKDIIKIAVLFSAAIVGWIFWVKQSIKDAEIQDKYEQPFFHNNILINGKVGGVNDSGNHYFGIIYLKDFVSNVKEFNPYKKDIFPYAIKNNEAEIYSWTCLYDVEEGDSIIVNSNDRSILVIKKDLREKKEGDLKFVNDEKDYIQQNSKLKFQ